MKKKYHLIMGALFGIAFLGLATALLVPAYEENRENKEKMIFMSEEISALRQKEKHREGQIKKLSEDLEKKSRQLASLKKSVIAKEASLKRLQEESQALEEVESLKQDLEKKDANAHG